MGTAEGQIKQINKKIDTIFDKLEQHRKEIEDLHLRKVEIKNDKANRKQLKKQMQLIESDHGVLNNQQTSLESYVEKYMPLKLQHQMAETVMEVLDKKAKLKFYELNCNMAEALREEIIKDSGHPKLKAKCLDLISKLRVEQ